MINKTTIDIEVRYAESDQMGVVHHGVYPQYFEVGRVHWLQQYNLHYHKLEQDGIMLPVYDLQIKYLKSAKFGDTLTVNTYLKELPNVKMQFIYEIFNQNDEKICIGHTTLVFVDEQNRRPMKCPNFILKLIQEKAGD